MSRLYRQNALKFPGTRTAEAQAYGKQKRIVLAWAWKAVALIVEVTTDAPTTGLRGIGALPAEVEMVAGHALPGVAGVYNLHKYAREKQKWLTKWAEHLNDLLSSR